MLLGSISFRAVACTGIHQVGENYFWYEKKKDSHSQFLILGGGGGLLDTLLHNFIPIPYDLGG